jgi:hypothetical protein
MKDFPVVVFIFITCYVLAELLIDGCSSTMQLWNVLLAVFLAALLVPASARKIWVYKPQGK